MTAKELYDKLALEYGLELAWPKVLEVDAETYGNVCAQVLSRLRSYSISNTIGVVVGPHGGIIFKGVELICRKPD